MPLEIGVPSQAKTLASALELAKKQGAQELLVKLEAGFTEPAEAWPLELAADSDLRSIEVLGTEDHDAAVRDVSLIGGAPELTVLLRSVVVRGPVVLSGRGCSLEDCEVRGGLEVENVGAGHVEGCTIRCSRVGIAVRGDVAIRDSTIEKCSIGICCYGNPHLALAGNTLRDCSAAALVMHVVLPPEPDALVKLATVIEKPSIVESCGREFEVHVDVPGLQTLSFIDEWPLPAGTHTVEHPRVGIVEVEIDDLGTSLSIATITPAEDDDRPRKRRRRQEKVDEECMGTKAKPAVGQALGVSEGPKWARKVLCLTGCEELTEKRLRAAYRAKAREVHPDKQGEQPDGNDTVPFHKVASAFEALLQELTSRKPPGEAAPDKSGRRRRKV